MYVPMHVFFLFTCVLHCNRVVQCLSQVWMSLA